jgi:hypothetical protein
MKLTHISLALSTTLLAALFSIGAGKAAAQAAAAIPPAITTPDKVESRLGVLEFKDGAPSAATVEKVYDTLDFIRGVDAFLNSYGGASAYAIREGFLSIGQTTTQLSFTPN